MIVWRYLGAGVADGVSAGDAVLMSDADVPRRWEGSGVSFWFPNLAKQFGNPAGARNSVSAPTALRPRTLICRLGDTLTALLSD